MTQHRPLVHVFLIQESMPLDALVAVSLYFRKRYDTYRICAILYCSVTHLEFLE